jgi:hypothetical protein
MYNKYSRLTEIHRQQGSCSARGLRWARSIRLFFLLRQGDDILIVQLYVDDIVFGSSSHSLVARFAKDMSKE